MIARIENEASTHIFNIDTPFMDLSRAQASVRQWPVPSVVMLRGSAIGALRFGEEPLPTSGPTLADEFDALLYLGGPRVSRVQPAAGERLRRHRIRRHKVGTTGTARDTRESRPGRWSQARVCGTRHALKRESRVG